MVLKTLLRYPFILIIVGAILIFVGTKALGYILMIVGAIIYLFNYFKNKPPKNQSNNTTDYTATTWWYMENNNG